MEKLVDDLFEKMFGGINLQLNVIVGVLLMIAGIIMISLSKKQAVTRKRTVGWICIGLGCLGALSGVLQLIMY